MPNKAHLKKIAMLLLLGLCSRARLQLCRWAEE